MTICKRLMRAAMIGALPGIVVSGCAGQGATPPAASARSARPANRYIYVTDQNLPGECYTDLGAVKITQSFADSAVDSDQSETAKRLRTAAFKTYPNDVDAVINVQSEQNDVGTEVTVSGEAVRLEAHPTVQCVVRGSKGVIDVAAVMAGAGIAGAGIGGLAGGAGTAATLGVGAAAGEGAHQALLHTTIGEQQQGEIDQTLADQRQQITQLLKQRAHLRKCQEQETTLKACLASPPPSGDDNVTETAEQDSPNASAFEIQRHLQEQQDYIKKLKDEIAQIEWQMGGH